MFRLISEIEELESLTDPWRELAHACACPAALPEWQLAWWHHLAPRGAPLRAIAVFEGERLVGLAPFFVDPGRRIDYRLLGGGMTHRVSPLALPRREAEIAEAVVSGLARCEPQPDLIALEAIDAASPWPEDLCRAWPGRRRPWCHTWSVVAAPVLDLDGQTFESWFGSRSRKFREEMRRARRKADKAGARVVLAENEAERNLAITAFIRLHLARRNARDGSSLSWSWADMLEEAATSLVPRGEMRLWVAELEGRPIAVNVALAAGGVLAGFNAGFDDEFAALEPGHLTTLAAIEDAFARGERRVDMGGGADPYKERLADTNLPIAWTRLVPRTRRYPLTQARLIPDRVRLAASRLAAGLPRERRSQLKRILRR